MAVMYIMRHGSTPFNDPNDPLYPGTQLRASSEVPLNDDGKEEAKQAARLLRNRGIVAIFASDLTRTIQTATIVNLTLNLPLSLDSRLDTWDLGLLSGQSEGSDSKGPDAEGPDIDPIIQWYEEHPDERVPGGESFNDFVKRVKLGIQDYETQPGGPVLLVTHGRIMDVLEYVRSGTGSPLIPEDDRPNPGSIIRVEPGVPGSAVVKMAAVETIQEDALRG